MPRRAVIVGAGPVGCLAALSLHKAGWSVIVYEARPGSPVSFSRLFVLLNIEQICASSKARINRLNDLLILQYHPGELPHCIQ
jgi:choline dehydrogenase-like flavoprotein